MYGNIFILFEVFIALRNFLIFSKFILEKNHLVKMLENLMHHNSKVSLIEVKNIKDT